MSVMRSTIKVILMVLLVCFGLISCKPETVADQSNPFLSAYNAPFNIPPFERIMAKHYMPAFEKGMEEGRSDIQKIVSNSNKPTFKNTVEAYDRAGELLTRVMMVFQAQAASNTNDSLQAIQIEISPKFAGFTDEVILNAELFN
ncbi:MAG: hypothetical protein A2X04_06630 [Bacteroidetes bacterium GWF2_41_9]|nr:MAG: hypothetical protein A2X03_05510 [Bacteroidetes bacterium GWA2_40_15]OFY57119.1 MAG: hypothetical protein A2X04_06630 [Bacteroidetes bacterium GWF2_41_9]HAM09457.1 hypothetical protein [Bacteroidales bacterium]HBH84124.1 hypothetical protein [Bacteroidales bacterium]HCU20716.1 hypothetical protein [Bacteroidales bacterium]